LFQGTTQLQIFPQLQVCPPQAILSTARNDLQHFGSPPTMPTACSDPHQGLHTLALCQGTTQLQVCPPQAILYRPEPQVGAGCALNMPDIAEVWRRGSVISSWLLDLGAAALAKDPQLKEFSGYVQDSGEGRWTVEAAIEEAVPADVLSTALYARFRSRQEHNFGKDALGDAFRLRWSHRG
jgi:hypothetical protein